MAKFYVKTHNYKIVLLADNYLSAAEKALRHWAHRDNFNPGSLTTVSEVGFEDVDGWHGSDKMYNTKSIVKIRKRKT